LTESEAIARAKEVALSKGWVWVEPVASTFRRGWFGRGSKWEVRTNAKGLGAIVHIVIDDATGKVLKESYVPR